MINLAIEVGKTTTPEAVMFWFLAPLAVLAALGMLLSKKAVHSAILLAWVMITLAIFYIAQDAVFLGIVQIVVYTGAVMMLFLFILMLVGVDSADSLKETIPGLRPIAITAAVGFGGLMLSLLGRATLGKRFRGESLANAAGLPNPGVYALHNAVDVPALLPDGTAAEASVSAMLKARGDVIDSKPFQLIELTDEEGEK